MKNLKILATIASLTLLVGCGKTEEKANQKVENTPANTQTETNKNKPKEEKSESELTSEDVIGEVSNLEMGKKVVKKAAINLNEEYTSGPFKVTLNNITINDLTPSKEYQEYFGTSDTFTMILVNLSVENNSEETNSIYPDQASLVTNTKEQLECDGMLSESIGGEYIGKVVKTGSILFYTTTKPEDINNVKLVINEPFDGDLNALGEKITIEHQF